MDITQPVASNYGYFFEKYAEQWAKTAEALKARFEGQLEEVLMPKEHRVDMPTIFVKKDSAHALLQFLKDEQKFNFLTDYTATDEEGEDKRFHLVVHLMAMDTKCRIRVKIRLSDGESFPSLIPIWDGANWAEREIYDMFGIRFDGHPDLRRILMDVRWEGHPLRKDYPLRGYQVFMTPEPIDPELLK